MTTVTVKYSGLSREVDVKEEVVQFDGSDYAALRVTLLRKYPPLTYTPALCLKDRTPMSPETELKDGDEVTFIAQIGGG